MFATFMEVLDTTVVNVSLPHIAGSLSATVDEATWTLTSYLVANAIILPITGWLANFFGRKRLLMSSVVRIYDRFVSMRAGAEPILADRFPHHAGRGRRRASAACRRQCCWRRFRHRIAAKRWASGGWASWWRRFWGRSSAAG